MPMTNDQIAALVDLVSSTTPDDMDCDGCLEHVAEYAETHLAGQEVADVLADVENHLANCPCCRGEFESLLEALRGMEDEIA